MILDGPSAYASISDSIQMNASSLIQLDGGGISISKKVFSDLYFSGNPASNIQLLELEQPVALHFSQATPSSSNMLLNLEFDGDVTLQDSLLIRGMLKPTGGTLTTNGKLTLVSTAQMSAQIGAGNSSNYISGAVAVQKYVPAIDRRYRFVAPTVLNANLLDVQNEIFITGNNAAGTATGTTPGTLNSAGFDATASNTPVM